MDLRGCEFELEAEDLVNLVNHVVLPPSLPQSQDADVATIQHNLLHLMKDTIAAMDHQSCTAWNSISKMLIKVESTEQANTLRDDVLTDELSKLELGGCLPLYLATQNSGVLMLRKDTGAITVEAFELSASNEDVMSTSGRLRRTFPGRAVVCPSGEFFNASFQSQLLIAIRRLATETPPEHYNPTTRKAQNNIPEERDTVHPGFVNDYLMAILSAIGRDEELVASPKCVREDVLWKDTRYPWRRAPFWLFLKISILRTLLVSLDVAEAQKQYKSFMMHVVAHLLDLTSTAQIQSDLISVIHVKLARRVFKFEQDFGQTSVSRISKISQKASQTLLNTWKGHIDDLEKMKSLPITGWDDATRLSLPASRQSLLRALRPIPASTASSSFIPESQSRIPRSLKRLPSLRILSRPKDITLLLADVESWVEKTLETWTELMIDATGDSPCDQLSSLIHDYWRHAASEYQCSPLEKSKALLIVMELWVALDSICIAKVPLLKEFPPEIPANLLEPLLLPKERQMHRLSAIETYIKDRWSRVSCNAPSVFTTPEDTSFCVRYYDGSSKLQQLRKTIEQSDKERRDFKIRELQREMETYNQLLADAGNLAHEQYYNDSGIPRHYPNACRKCQKQKQAGSMRIVRIEESLPPKAVQIKAAVFELELPIEFAAWRDTTWFVINDIGQREHYRASDMSVTVQAYEQLEPYLKRSTRITLGSSTKPHLTESHYHSTQLPTTIDTLYVKNGLNYDIWDTNKCLWLTWPSCPPSFKAHCTHSLTHGPYANLEWAVGTSKHTTNEAMSKRSSCDDRLEIREFDAFCQLRAGERIQWLNIVRELGCNNLDYANPAVTTLVLQAAWEAGSPSNDCFRETHVHFRDPEFCQRLLSMLQRRLKAIESNWDKQYSMMTLVQLTLRLLSLTSSPTIESECLGLLRDARQVSLEWCHQLQEHMHKSSTQASVQKEGSNRLLNAALMCFSTFDVDDRHIADCLSSTEDLSVLTEAQVLICDNRPANSGILPLLLQQSLLHYTSIVHMLEPQVYKLLAIDGSGLNRTIRKLWNGVTIISDWHTVSQEAPWWIFNRTIPNDGAESQTVHYNLLAGSLLVNGKPLGMVPEELRAQGLFKQIFGSAILHVGASDMPGMDYRVSQYIHGNEVHIGSRDGTVIIKARSNGSVFQALRQDVFHGELPIHFVESFHHWLDEAAGSVEFRLLESPWQSSADHWYLTFSSLDFLTATAQMHLKQKSQVDLNSTIGKSVTHILRVLDNAFQCHIMLDDLRPFELEVYLPRYNLHFVVTEAGRLVSLEFNAIVDENQCIGTLIGLQDKLVLRDDIRTGYEYERRVIIPYGKVEIQKKRDYVNVHIRHDGGLKRRFFVYNLDRHLTRLRGAQDILGLLHKAYLHAITSFPLPDPFTGRTGTEEAIAILKEASLFTTVPLTEEEIRGLNTIAALTPLRQFYPAHKKVMQSVTWNSSLSQLSQHDDFILAAEAIFQHHANFETLFGQFRSGNVSSLYHGDRMLLDRARMRNASVTRSGLFADVKAPGDNDDRTYTGRDRFDQNVRAAQVYDIAKLVNEWPSRVATHTNLAAIMKEWDLVAGYHNEFDMQSATMNTLTTFQFWQHWGSIYDICRFAQRDSMTYPLMFTFCAIAHGSGQRELVHIMTLLAFAFSGAFRHIHPPPAMQSYTLETGSCLSEQTILQAIRRKTSEVTLPSYATRDEYQDYVRKNDEIGAQVLRFCQRVASQWPASSLSVPGGEYSYIHIWDAKDACQTLFDEWHKNRNFLNHIQTVNTRLLEIQSSRTTHRMSGAAFRQHPRKYTLHRLPSLGKLLQDDARANSVEIGEYSFPLSHQPKTVPGDATELESLVIDLCSSPDSTHSNYGLALRASLKAFCRQQFDDDSYGWRIIDEQFWWHFEGLSKRLTEIVYIIRRALAPGSTAEMLLSSADLWPRTAKSCLLNQLSATKFATLNLPWISLLLKLGQTIASLQRSERMLKLCNIDDKRNLRKELKNSGREGWSAEDYPSWLLLEIENNITIRPQQAKVAIEMMAPKSGSNSVLQLNMGEGKSSVIIPMLVAALAEGKRLVRVIVLKPLLRQTEQVLSQRLGGMLDQRVYHVPFSRKTEISSETIRGIDTACTDCRNLRGVMIALPEEILSMRLMTREKMASDRALAASILNLQRSSETFCRDVIDESDEVLGIRSQLIYPVGTQQMLNGKSDRWLIAQAVLCQVKLRATDLAERYPSQLEIDYNGKSFPILKFLCTEICSALIDILIKDAMDGHIAGIAFDYYTDDTRDAIRNFIGCRDIAEKDMAIVTRDCSNSLHWHALLILRGLLTHGVLQFALERKRWLVEYGLDPGRCFMAVPYRAKGVPSQNSEFGHPDVGLLLTCLSYYYTGLTKEQVHDSFKILLKDSNAQDVYHGWASACQNLPESLKSFEAINLDDRTLCETALFPQMQFNLKTIDFFLNQVVFPKEGKEFAKRLSASGWDIPSASGSPELLTTGFSGTNDSRDTLPFSIRQQDLEELHHTNAMVLNLVLQKENQTYIHGGGSDGKKLGIEELLSLLTQESPHINVLIDVGAQVLEATNLQLVQRWLMKEVDAKAAVYFDDLDEAMVLDRSGLTTPLRISPFCGKLEKCLIYLDEVHTRGIDLAIPLGARAAVTLGPRLVKDRLVQACMRLRSLGNGHSLCFISPNEVHRSICDMKERDDSYTLTSRDVLAWCMEQTCQALDIARPLRAMHGLEFLRQQKVLCENLPPNSSPSDLASDEGRMQSFWQAIQEDESMTLELLYGIHEERIGAFERLLDRGSTNAMMQHLVEEYGSMNKLVLEDSTMDNEQERELAHEIERQRHVQRPPPMTPLTPKVSTGLALYVKTGSINSFAACNKYSAFELFFETTAKDSARSQKINPFKFQVSVTHDFMRSVAMQQGSLSDSFLRPISWVLSSSKHGRLLVISPHEANELLPQIKASNQIRLHIYSPRLSKDTVSFRHLDFYTPNSTPEDCPCSAEAIRDLELFAGSLYLENESQYESLCHFLGLVTRSRRARDMAVNSDGFVDPETRQEIGWPENCPFTHTPLPFLKQVFTLRNFGQGFASTHMGSLLNGRALRDSAFDGCDDRLETTNYGLRRKEKGQNTEGNFIKG